jgi:hypothetical protein
MDDVDYYPDEYLNRLAHEGVNGLWLSIKFIDLVPSRFFPAHAKDHKVRIAKLQRTVAHAPDTALRYSYIAMSHGLLASRRIIILNQKKI